LFIDFNISNTQANRKQGIPYSKLDDEQAGGRCFAKNLESQMNRDFM
jgi:hypothetical protein